MLVAAACFTIMNVLIKEASAKFALGSGELVFWRMLFSTVALGAAAVLRRDTFRTPHWKNHLNRSMVGTGAMLLLFYAVTHLPLATGVTLSYTSSIFFGGIFLPDFERTDFRLHAGGAAPWFCRRGIAA